MNLTRRDAILLPATVAVTSALPFFGGADAAGRLTTDDYAQLLDNAAWIPDGPPNSRHVYVIAAPWCPICKALYLSSRGITKNFQLRWIMAYSKSQSDFLQNAAVAIGQNADLLSKIYRSDEQFSGISQSAKWLAEWNAGVQYAMYTDTNILGTPLQIYMGKNGEWIVKGGAQMDSATKKIVFSDILNNIKDRPESKNVNPRALEMISSNIESRQIGDIKLYAADNNTQINYVPTDASPVILSLQKGQGRTVSHIATDHQTGQQWACFEFRTYLNEFHSDTGWTKLDQLRTIDGRRVSG